MCGICTEYSGNCDIISEEISHKKMSKNTYNKDLLLLA